MNLGKYKSSIQYLSGIKIPTVVHPFSLSNYRNKLRLYQRVECKSGQVISFQHLGQSTTGSIHKSRHQEERGGGG